MTKGKIEGEIQMIPVNDIEILNDRARNKKTFHEMTDNITKVGLKRPITVRRADPGSEKPYELVCGQGRLESFIACKQAEIPAMIIDVSQEDALLMGLVENDARRKRSTLDLFKAIESLRSRGYDHKEIAQKTGLSKQYMGQIMQLMERGEERLISAVEAGQIPINTALSIALSNGDEQHALQEAYENNELRGKKLMKARRLIETRKRCGKSIRTGTRTPPKSQETLSSRDIVNLYKKEVDRKKSLTQKAEFVNTKLVFISEALRRLFAEDHFHAILKAEDLITLPKPLSDMLEQRETSHG